MKKTLLITLVLITAVLAQGQMMMPGVLAGSVYGRTLAAPSPDSTKKWSVSKFTSLSAGYSFFRGGSAMVLSAPMSLQLNRRITPNVYAFAGVSAAPAFVNFNSALRNTNFTKTNAGTPGFMQASNFGIYSRAEVGLMYINPEKTFSISGSIGIERNNYPMFYPPAPSTRPRPAALPYQ